MEKNERRAIRRQLINDCLQAEYFAYYVRNHMHSPITFFVRLHELSTFGYELIAYGGNNE